MFVCLDACKQGFKAGCRPLIGLDGCFLKGYYGGKLLSAVGQDGNNQIYVIAYAIVDVELHLRHAKGMNNILVFFSFKLCPFFACILMYSNS